MGPNTLIAGLYQTTTDKQRRPIACDVDGRLMIGAAAGGLPVFNTLTTTAPAYTAGDNVGGEWDLPLVADAFAVFRLDHFTIIDPAAQSANLMVLFFAAAKAVTGATMTDNAAFTWGAGTARSAYSGAIEITAADWKTVDSQQVATLTNTGLIVRANSTGSVYAAIVALGAPNFGNGSLFVKPGFVRL